MPRKATQQRHRKWMDRAIALARTAGESGQVPVGAVLVGANDELLAEAHNLRRSSCDPTAHAEINVLRAAAKAAGSWRLDGTTLYVTLEPCPMCAGAIVNSRCERVVFGCADAKAGAVRSLFAICDDARLNHRVEVFSGVRGDTCAQLLTDFFRQRRAKTNM